MEQGSRAGGKTLAVVGGCPGVDHDGVRAVCDAAGPWLG